MSEIFTIKSVCRLTGVNESTLRVWESKYGIIEPARSVKGTRRYSKKDVSKIAVVRKLREKGIAIKDICDLDHQSARKLLQSLDQAESPSTKNNHKISELEKAIVAHDVHRMHKLLTELRTSTSVLEFVSDILSGTIRIVGQRVLEGEFSIAQEHTFSAIVKAHLNEICFNLRPLLMQDPTRGITAITTPEGDHHDIGILMAQAIFHIKGYDVLFLGPNMPCDSMVELIESLNLSRVLIGTSMIAQNNLAIPFPTYLEEISNSRVESLEIMVGGGCYGVQKKLPKLDNLKIISTMAELVQQLEI